MFGQAKLIRFGDENTNFLRPNSISLLGFE